MLNVDLARQQEVVRAFLAASRDGDFVALVALLDPDVALRADPGAVPPDGSGEVHGGADVANTFSGRAKAVQLALINVNGAAGAIWGPRWNGACCIYLHIEHEKIIEIDLIADPPRIDVLDFAVLDE